MEQGQRGRDLVTAVDPNTLQLKIPEDFAPTLVLNLMATVAASVVEKKVATANEANGEDGNGWLKTHSATSGARSAGGVESQRVGDDGGQSAITRPGKDQAGGYLPRARTGFERLLLEKGDVDIALSLQPDQLKSLAEQEGRQSRILPVLGTGTSGSTWPTRG